MKFKRPISLISGVYRDSKTQECCAIAELAKGFPDLAVDFEAFNDPDECAEEGSLEDNFLDEIAGLLGVKRKDIAKLMGDNDLETDEVLRIVGLENWLVEHGHEFEAVA